MRVPIWRVVREDGRQPVAARARRWTTSNIRIGQLARATGFNEKTLRYYDQIGLLRSAGRSPSGYRLYCEDAIERLRFIRNAQDLGLSLSDIQDILEISDGGRVPCRHVLAVVERDLSEIDSQIKRLRELRRALLGAKARLDEALPVGGIEAGHGCRCLAADAPTTDLQRTQTTLRPSRRASRGSVEVADRAGSPAPRWEQRLWAVRKTTTPVSTLKSVDLW